MAPVMMPAPYVYCCSIIQGLGEDAGIITGFFIFIFTLTFAYLRIYFGSKPGVDAIVAFIIMLQWLFY